jgi:hypothetical protein
MSDYSRRSVTTITVEFSVDAPSKGSGEANYWSGLRDAMHAITKEIGPDRAACDDSVRIEARGDQIVLSYEVTNMCAGSGRVWKSVPGGAGAHLICPVCYLSAGIITYPEEPKLQAPEHVGVTASAETAAE